jgi:5-oxoprolinase (ATP-hydrolysing) subunit A
MVSTQAMEGVIDLNADVGEVDDPDDLEVEMFRIITSANIATGGHAGNPEVMEAAVACASRLGVSVGAHPSYPDRDGFGRKVVSIEPEELREELTSQIRTLDEIARSHGLRLRHVKPHGALYHRMLGDPDTALVVAEVTAGLSAAVLVTPAGGIGVLEKAVGLAGVRTIAEAFCDRGYRPDGSLVARGEVGDLLTDPSAAAAQAVSIAARHQVEAVDGTVFAIDAQTLCVHGDTPGAADIASAVKAALLGAGLKVESPI